MGIASRITCSGAGKGFVFLVLSLLLSAAGHAQGNPAGRVVFASGAPQAVDATGAARALARGDDVFQGDTLTTDARSRLQVSFVDGAYVSVQPGSEYRIEEYRYAGQPDGNEKATYRLLKGGLRALTGLIGRDKPDAYTVETSVATIGVRGTGHNSRLCDGDCPTQDDGLYHHTTEGTTFVKNNVDEQDVPTGSSVYVPDINSNIIFLDQTPGITALDTGQQKEEEQEEREDYERLFTAGDQRDDEGEQLVFRDVEEPEPMEPMEPERPVTFSSVLGGQSFLTVRGLPNEPAEGFADISSFQGGNILLDDNGNFIGVLGDFFEDDDMGNEFIVRTLGTIDLSAALGADDPAIAAEVQDLLDSADPDLVALFDENPAQLAEFTSIDEISFGRIANGRLLAIDQGETEIIELVDFQSIHFIYGPDPGPLPTSGSANYNFGGGTQSTSVSGATIGDGAINGFISVDFGLSEAFINMDVDHDGVFYFVSGQLNIEPDGVIFDDNVTANTGDPGSACNPMCPTFIDGGFAGPDDAGTPRHIGIEYDIQDTDTVIGVAGFMLGP